MKRSNVDDRITSFLISSSSYFSFPELAFALISGDHKETEVFRPGKETGGPVLYKVGSLTKLVTCLAIMKLREEGLLDLNDAVSKHLNLFADQCEGAASITILDLLLHISGLPRGDFYNISPSFEIIKSKLKAFNPTGIKVYKYSNLGYVILGFLIEQLSKEKYVDYVRKEILDPLGMTVTGFGKEYAAQHMTVPHGLACFSEQNKTPYDYREISLGAAPEASFDLHSSIEDFSNLISCILNKGKFKGQKIWEESTIDLLQNMTHPVNSKLNSGLGMLSVNIFNEVMLFQSGEHWGHSAAVLLLPGQKMGLIAMTNRSSAGNDLLYTLQKVRNYLINKGNQNFLNYDYSKPENITGTYISADNEVLKITSRANAIFINDKDGKKEALIYKGQNCFLQPDGHFSKYVIGLDLEGSIIKGLNIGPFYFRKGLGKQPADTLKKYNRLTGVYFNAITGRVAIFQRNTNLILAYSSFKEAILQETARNVFLQLSGPFVNEVIFIKSKSKELIIGDLIFKQTLTKY